MSSERVNALLASAISAGATDLHLVPGERPWVRRDGVLAPLGDEPPLDAVSLEVALDDLAPGKLTTEREVEFGHRHPDGHRFRATAFRERRGVALAFRIFPGPPPSLDDLGVPRDVLRAVYAEGGLVLCAGHAGAGKTTTQAAMLQELCRRRSVHVVTVEDPIEYALEHGRAWVEQREVGLHVRSFEQGVRAALESDPDVIALGELRDLETMRLALQAAGTGTLVLATIHAYDVPRTIARFVDAFPPERRPAVRSQLATVLRTIVAQTLCRRREGGRIAAVEVAHGGPALAALIREGRDHEVPTLLQTSRGRGMRVLDDSLVELARAGTVEPAEVLRRATNPEACQRRLQALAR